MTLRLPEDTVYPENVIENLVEENERNVKLFLVENFESGSGKNIRSVQIFRKKSKDVRHGKN